MNTKAFNALFSDNINFKTQLKVIPRKGNLVYEYNPFLNYRLTEPLFEFKGLMYNLGELYHMYGIYPNISGTFKVSSNGDAKTIQLHINDAYYIENDFNYLQLLIGVLEKQKDVNWVKNSTDPEPILRETGELVDFDTSDLKVDLNHPVLIIPQPSYDGSVNLILNDGINIPRLINSRFSVTGRNTYEVVDRKGNDDTNIYDLGELFKIDTSLYKRITKIPKILFNSVKHGGNLKVGNYHFYFKLADSDGNETDFIGESGLVSVFIGNSYKSAHTGQKDENSLKLVEFSIGNLDRSYNTIIVYFSRSSAEGTDNNIPRYYKITDKFLITNYDLCKITITGNEALENVTVYDINPFYNVVDSAKASATCLNMLFLANVHKPDIPYKELEDLSLRFLPYLHEEAYDSDIDVNYNSNTNKLGYIDPKYIYDKTGYWGEELYRLGIVYILPNDTLSPVFNIRGAHRIPLYKEKENFYTDIPLYKDGERNFILYDNDTYYIENSVINRRENAKGVVSFYPTKDTDTIYGINVKVDDATIKELKKYVKGYFFVRLSRIPTILALGITIGVDVESRTPTLPTTRSFLDTITYEDTYVTTEDINDVNYISEGFLTRYRFDYEELETSFWEDVGKVALIAAGAALAVAATIVTFGGTAVVAAAVAGSALIATVGVKAYAEGWEYVVNEALLFLNRKKRTLNGKETKVLDGYDIVELELSRQLGGDFVDRVIIKDPSKNKVQAILCPDYSINQPYFNLIFTGNKHLIKSTRTLCINYTAGYSSNYFTSEGRHFYVPGYEDIDVNKDIWGTFSVIGIPDDTQSVGLGNLMFKSRAGYAEEAFRVEQVGVKYTDEKVKKNTDDEYTSLKLINSDLIRGSFGSYVAFDDENDLFGPVRTVNIYIPEYSENKMDEYYKTRMLDVSLYYSISDRYNINEKKVGMSIDGVEEDESKEYTLFRGDCYICQFTHRVIRNFNDPAAPYNDQIVDKNSWRDNYDPLNPESYININSGDVNAVELGMWVTFKIRSSNNLNIRTLDGSNVSEAAASGHARGYYPYYPMSTEGSYKLPDSSVYNKGFTKLLSDKFNIEVPDVPHIKNWFGTRIMYSDIHVNDAFKNGFRVFLGTNYRDYTREYGEIVKLVPIESNLLVVFEHGIGLATVNERAVAAQGAGGNVYINSSNVLPENLFIISDMFGSLWAESVLKVPGKTGDSALYVYGVDTVAKKIWRTNGKILECISDMRVQEFLNNNITLGERELTPKIGIRNVKTVYNAFKRDVLFTFYDNTYGFEEKVWNLCWNETLEKFITFYSWVPSYMENINNIPFSFNRDTSKWIAKLGASHSESSIADGITLSNVITKNKTEEVLTKSGDKINLSVNDFTFNLSYINKKGEEVSKLYTVAENSRDNYIGVLSLKNRTLPNSLLFYNISYSLERDNYLNFTKFEIVPINIEGLTVNEGVILPSDAKFYGLFVPVYALKFKNADSSKESIKNTNRVEELLTELYYRNSANKSYADYDTNKKEPNFAISLAGRIINGKVTNLDRLLNESFESYKNSVESYLRHVISKDFLVNRPIFYTHDVNYNTFYKDNLVFINSNNLYNITLYRVVSIIDLLEWDQEKPYIKLGNIRKSLSELTVYYGNPICVDLPIFKDITGKRKMLPKDLLLNPDKIVTLLNIKADINLIDTTNEVNRSDAYYNLGKSVINVGYYESVVAITPQWNLLFLNTDFWKHGLSGIIDITDDIYPTCWYGKQHPFEFECLVVNDPSIHKIFTNLELIANKVKPESFHYEIVGDAYDFAKDKNNMYFRQEAIKALWLYNGADICYNRDFLKTQPKQQNKSADFPHLYYSRQDTINEIEDYYIGFSSPTRDYTYLSGSEIVYYPTTREYRVWSHSKAIDIDDLRLDDGRSAIAANCAYLEDRWRININPIIVCYKNEYSDNLFKLSTWTSENRPKLPVMNSPIPDKAYNSIINKNGEVEIPEVLTDLGYTARDIDHENWLNQVDIYGTSFRGDLNRKETDVRGKFVKIRIRYSGEELAIIDFLNTIYRISYA